MARTFSNSEALHFGWSAARRHIRVFVPIVALAVLVPSLFNRVFLLSYVADAVMALGMFKIALAFADGTTPGWEDLFWSLREPRQLLRYLVAETLYFLLVGLGLFLLVIPGIYWALKYGFYGWALADGTTDIFEAFQISARATAGVKINLLLFGLLAGLVTLAGFLAFLVGLVWAIPTVTVALAHIYRKLSKD